MSDLISQLTKNQPVFVDTSIFIYTFESNFRFGRLATAIFDAASQKK